jgi:hypothetical protein
MYYATTESITYLHAGALISFSIEQAVIQYKLRNDLPRSHSVLNSVLPAIMYSFTISEDVRGSEGKDLEHADIDYILGRDVDLETSDVRSVLLRNMMFIDDTRLRSLLHTKTMDDLVNWMETYRPVKVIDQYITMTNTFAEHLAHVMEHGVTSDIVEPIRENAGKLKDLQEKLIVEYFNQENEVSHYKQLIDRLLSFENIDDARQHYQVERHKPSAEISDISQLKSMLNEG